MLKCRYYPIKKQKQPKCTFNLLFFIHTDDTESYLQRTNSIYSRHLQKKIKKYKTTHDRKYTHLPASLPQHI